MRLDGTVFKRIAFALLWSLAPVWAAWPEAAEARIPVCARDTAGRPNPDAEAIDTPEAAVPKVPAADVRRYALIINGDASSHHVQNCLDAYHALRANGFQDKDIFMLSNEPRVGGLRIPTLGPNDGPPTFRNLATVFKFLQGSVRSSDTVVIYVTGHGGSEAKGEAGNCFIELVPRANETRVAGSPELGIDEFIDQVEEIHPKRGLLVFDQCYGQAFATQLGKGPFAAIALSTESEEVYCQNFSPLFWKELRRAGLEKKRLLKNSLKLAYQKAARVARQKEKTQRPMIKCGFDSGKFFLWE